MTTKNVYQSKDTVIKLFGLIPVLVIKEITNEVASDDFADKQPSVVIQKLRQQEFGTRN